MTKKRTAIEVIFIDDEPFAIESIMDRMEQEKLPAKLYTDPLLALEFLATPEQAVKIAVIDSFLPNTHKQYYFENPNSPTKIAGISLAKYIHTHYPHIKLVIYTVLTDDEIINACKENGFQTYFENRCVQP